MSPSDSKSDASGHSDKGQEPPLVLVTGASGYIALHIVRLLLKEGYRVRGTVRSVSNQKKLKPLRAVCPEASEHLLDFIEADLTKDEGWSEAVRGCDYVLHVASPFPNTPPKCEDDLLKPAVDGTKRVFTACADEMLKSGSKLKRVVLTSSIAAVHGETVVDKELYTEEDWSDSNSKYLDAYPKSKTLAERAAWDFVKELPEKQRFELSVINPGIVFGPILSNEAATSVEIIARAMDVITMPLVPRVNLCICDVRDVALAHLKAMILPEAVGKRHLIVSGHHWMGDVTKILHDEFSEFGYRVPMWPSPFIAMWFYSFLDKPTRLLLHRVGKVYTFDNQRMKTILGIEPRHPKETILDTAHDLIQRGVIQCTKKYVPPKTDTKL